MKQKAFKKNSVNFLIIYDMRIGNNALVFQILMSHNVIDMYSSQGRRKSSSTGFVPSNATSKGHCYNF